MLYENMTTKELRALRKSLRADLMEWSRIYNFLTEFYQNRLEKEANEIDKISAELAERKHKRII